MNVILPGLAPVQLELIADALARPGFDGNVDGVIQALGVGVSAASTVAEVRSCLARSTVAGVASVLRAVAAERRGNSVMADKRLELVWTGPERDGTATRDTAIVVRELFQAAEHEVVVAGYALYNARRILQPLAERMHALPELRVRLIVNIASEQNVSAEQSLAGFAQRFKSRYWPKTRLPSVFYDSRAFDARPERRAVMHAKCVIVDGKRCFLGSANLTEAAQERNIELGVIINDAAWCGAVRVQFDDLIGSDVLTELQL